MVHDPKNHDLRARASEPIFAIFLLKMQKSRKSAHPNVHVLTLL
jgi:hypothetical protein